MYRMHRRVTALSLAATLCSACDTGEGAGEDVDDAVAPSGDATARIYYDGERFTLDELGEPPRILVELVPGEVHGFDSEEDARAFARADHIRTAPAEPTVQTNCGGGFNEVHWFEHESYQGWGDGTYTPGYNNYVGAYWNDRISSLKNHSDYTVIFYDHANYQGDQYWVGPRVCRENLWAVGWNDRFSSWSTY